jgi:hypothetical protein
VAQNLAEANEWALIGWSERAATLAVRLGSRELVVLGLVAASLPRTIDTREILRIVPLHRRAATLVGADVDAVFSSAAAHTDQRGRDLLETLRNSTVRLEDMGFIEDYETGEFAFRETNSQVDTEGILRDYLDE